MAHKKAAGSAKNLRDSNPKFRGVKLFGGQTAKAGNIIIRQKGSKYEAGPNTYVTKDFSIHASVDGIVRFYKKKKAKFDGRKYLKTYVTVDTEATAAKKVEQKAEKPAAKKTAEKKAPAKKKTTTPKKVDDAKSKKPAAKKATAKKAPAKKPAAKKQAAKKTGKKE